MRVVVRAPRSSDQRAFLDAVHRSRRLHRPWAYPASSPRPFRAFLAQNAQLRHKSYLVVLEPEGHLAGVVQLSEIVRGAFRITCLGYYGFLPHNGRGYMTLAIGVVIGKAFGSLKLHRLEANIQPGNQASIAVVRRLGFRKEGYSPRYLKIGGCWRDHERWALVKENWKKT